MRPVVAFVINPVLAAAYDVLLEVGFCLFSFVQLLTFSNVVLCWCGVTCCGAACVCLRERELEREGGEREREREREREGGGDYHRL